MDIPEEIKDNVYVAGAVIKDGSLLTNGGRVLGATATDENLEGAIKKAYGIVSKIKFEKVGYQFKGWNTQKDGQGKGYLADEEIQNLSTEQKAGSDDFQGLPL